MEVSKTIDGITEILREVLEGVKPLPASIFTSDALKYPSLIKT